MLAVLIVVRDEYRAARDIELGWQTLVYYADRLVWIGLAMTLFPVMDMAYRSASASELMLCRGPMNSVLVGLSALLLVQFSISFGMILMADVATVAERTPLWLLNGYGVLLIGAALCSFAYVVRLQARKLLGRGA